VTASTSSAATASALPAGAVVSHSRRLFGFGLVLSIVVLIFAGAQVKSHNAGLAEPDWPLGYGQLWPSMVGGVFHEHGHRAIATLIGLATVIMAIWTVRTDSRRWVRQLSCAVFCMVCLQGLLGGLTVWFLLPSWLSASHGTLAQVFLCVSAWLAYSCSQEWSRASSGELTRREIRDDPDGRATRRAYTAGVLAVVVVFLQLILGAWMRHTEAGLAVDFFPLSAQGEVVPEFVDERVVIHMAHRLFAVVVACMVWRLSVLAGVARGALQRHGAILAMVVLLQGLLGAMVIWQGRSPVVTSLHVTNGALVLLLTWLLSLRLWRRAHLGDAP
jgi:cytochrome c oxidase assembly protein subunit 15